MFARQLVYFWNALYIFRLFLCNSQYIFRVSRKHSGVYVCEGDNGFGAPSRDFITVNVQCRFKRTLRTYNSSFKSIFLKMNKYPINISFWNFQFYFARLTEDTQIISVFLVVKPLRGGNGVKPPETLIKKSISLIKWKIGRK